MDETLSNNNKKIEELFRSLDDDGSGTIEVEELLKVLSENGEVDLEQIKELIAEVDENSDGKVSLDEFKAMMREM